MHLWDSNAASVAGPDTKEEEGSAKINRMCDWPLRSASASKHPPHVKPHHHRHPYEFNTAQKHYVRVAQVRVRMVLWCFV